MSLSAGDLARDYHELANDGLHAPFICECSYSSALARIKGDGIVMASYAPGGQEKHAFYDGRGTPCGKGTVAR